MNERIALLESRLGDLARVLENDPDGLALLGLGSAGVERERLDEWSDLDFFAIVRSGTKARFLSDTSWLDRAHPVSYLFRNTADGFKLLFDDGVFGEMAVFEPAELSSIPFSPGAVLWSRQGFDISSLEPTSSHGTLPREIDVDHAVGELVTCLYVGLCRFRRGEFLSAWRFVQVYCLDRVLELASVWYPSSAGFPDRYTRDRRAEIRHPDLIPVFESALIGYRSTPSAALSILCWVESRVPVNASLKAEIVRLARGE